MTKKMLPEKEYYASLPKKRMAGGALFINDAGQILLVHPTYKPRWEIPGGVTEDNESLRQGTQREVLEELGLEREIGHLLVVEYQPQVGNKTESLMFIFDGGVLTESDIENIHLQEAELDEFDFFPVDALPEAMSPVLRQRVQRAYAERCSPQDAYIEPQV